MRRYWRNSHLPALALTAPLLFGVHSTRAAAQQPMTNPTNSLFVFGGVLNSGNLGQTVLVFGNKYESSGIAGAAFRSEFVQLPNKFDIGAEIGTGLRFGDGTSGEFWGGGTLTYRGFDTGKFTVIPTGVFGLSAITNTTGVEKARAIQHSGNETLLFYLGLEVAFTTPQWQGWEVVYRVHHRSGGYELLGHVIEGHNANVIGLRHYF
jgi:hypothetical protein